MEQKVFEGCMKGIGDQEGKEINQANPGASRVPLGYWRTLKSTNFVSDVQKFSPNPISNLLQKMHSFYKIVGVFAIFIALSTTEKIELDGDNLSQLQEGEWMVQL
jgi:hypothetical protein